MLMPMFSMALNIYELWNLRLCCQQILEFVNSNGCRFIQGCLFIACCTFFAYLQVN